MIILLLIAATVAAAIYSFLALTGCGVLGAPYCVGEMQTAMLKEVKLYTAIAFACWAVAAAIVVWGI